MKLTLAGIENPAPWQAAGIQVPAYDVLAVQRKTIEAPQWVHFGIGNIFRVFIGGIADGLLSQGLMDRGLTCVEAFDYDVVDKIYQPYDNLGLQVILNSDGTRDIRVLGAFAEAIKAQCTDGGQWTRLKEIFRAPSLQLVSFTITEKGYALKNPDGSWLGYAAGDIAGGPNCAVGAMGVVTAMLHERFQAGGTPIALVSMDNCAGNGKLLRKSVLTMAKAWQTKGFVKQPFLDWLEQEENVAFDSTMIDKITPRPSEDIAADLEKMGIEDMQPVVTGKRTYIAPFANAERPQYLVIEDRFPNGRPPLEKGFGVYMGSFETVRKSERMKVTACLNPAHTAVGPLGVVLGQERFADMLRDLPVTLKMAKRVVFDEGMPVAPDPGILSPKAFAAEVFERFQNLYLGDTNLRLATDASQGLSVRFGETIKSYVVKDGTASALVAIPLGIAGFFRYAMGVDDWGRPFELAPDPLVPEIHEALQQVKLGMPESYHGELKPYLSNESIFGVNLYQAGLGEKIEGYFKEMIAALGGTLATVEKYIGVEHMATMKQQVMTRPAKNGQEAEIIFRDIEIPVPGPEQVLVKIKRIGVCGSDIHVYYGEHASTSYPVTQGHEVSGQVAAVGKNVTAFVPGQKVTIEPQVVCGKCYPCRHGKYNLCEELKVMGFQTTGAASEYFCVDQAKVTPLPQEMSYDDGAMIEPLAVTVHAAHHFSEMNGAKVAILGCGPIGILLAQTCKALGAESVLITDVSDYRLALAKQCGIDYAVNTKNVEFGKALVDAFGPDKADVIYDCAGNNVTINQAIRCARKGSKLILVAVFAGMATADLFILNDHELDLDTTMMYRHEDYVEAIRLVEEGKVRLQPLQSAHFPFERYLDAYKYIEANRETTMKVLIDVDQA